MFFCFFSSISFFFFFCSGKEDPKDIICEYYIGLNMKKNGNEIDRDNLLDGNFVYLTTKYEET